MNDLIKTDIESYLHQHENKDMLRFLTCGSVDDGKSTLIGRILYDSKMILDDQMKSIEQDSKRFNTTDETIDLALLVDGLQSEREQGITIDVAYRYFTTEKRKFIIADTPGHEQYTRNMATGASTCDLAIILIDARYGVQVQTKRHSFIVSKLGIKHIIVAVNKMDLINYDQEAYRKIKNDYKDLVKDLNFVDVRFVPMSALKGDNVVNESQNMSWYPGATLIKLLNTIEIKKDEFKQFRFPVQYVNRPNLNFRGFAGTIVAGDIRVGDTIVALPSNKQSKIASIVTFDGELESAEAGSAITLTLEDEIDIGRGDMLVCPSQLPNITSDFQADLVWMSNEVLKLDREYYLKIGSFNTTASIKNIEYKYDINNFTKREANQLELNEVALCSITTMSSIMFDSYLDSRKTGCFILIDKLTNETVASGMITKPLSTISKPNYTAFELEFNALIRKQYPHWQVKDISKQ